MPFHTLAFYESVDPGAAYNAITPVPDQELTVSGDDVRIPAEIARLIGVAALINDASGARGRVISPSLRSLCYKYIDQIPLALVFGSPPEAEIFPAHPISLTPGEMVNLELYSDPASAVVHYGVLWLSDGQNAPIQGDIRSIRVATSITLSAGAWVQGSITLEDDLPVGVYDVVGMRARGTNLVAARLKFTGQAWRPGVPAVNAIGDNDLPIFRRGALGVWGTFDTDNLPKVDALGVTDSAQVLILDLLRRS